MNLVFSIKLLASSLQSQTIKPKSITRGRRGMLPLGFWGKSRGQ